MFKYRYQGAAVALLWLGLSLPGVAKQVEVHDPVMTKEGPTYYVFSTGPGITYYSSSDMRHWNLVGRVFKDKPSWADRVAPGFDGHLWAPDIVQHNGKFYLYYSASAFGKNTSGIGVTVTQTLNPKSKDSLWVDQGIVLQSVPFRDDWNAIDPAVSFDEHGTPWMAFGSFWSGIKLTRLDPDLVRLSRPQVWYNLARRPNSKSLDEGLAGDGAIEAPFIFHKGGYYYLFVSFDYCCRKMDSTYNIRVGRSTHIQGPYTDKAGKPMMEGGGTLVLKGTKDWVALGHNGVYHFDGKDYMVFHAYETADDALQKLRILEVHWKDGWPTVDPADLNKNTTELER